MKKKQKGVSRKRHSTLKTGNTMLNKKNIPARVKTVTKKNKSGYLQTYEVNQCENCEGCPFRELCTKPE